MLPAVAAGLALVVNALAPLVSALLIALALGAVVVNVARTAAAQHSVPAAEGIARHMLRIGIVLLGLQMPLTDLAGIGWQGVLVVVATVTVTFLVTVRVGSRLGLDRGLSTLIAAGFSICGASAIAAVSQTVRARSRDVGIAVALVTLYGTAMIAVLPWAAGRLGLGTQDAATWAGASIHEVAQVVAAGSLLGGGALVTATTVKLARVVLIAPMTALTKRRHGSGRGAAVPWFVTGFLLAVLVRSVVDLPTAALGPVAQLATFLLAGGMFGMGLAINARDLWPLPVRALALGAVATAVAAGTSLGLVVLL